MNILPKYETATLFFRRFCNKKIGFRRNRFFFLHILLQAGFDIILGVADSTQIKGIHQILQHIRA